MLKLYIPTLEDYWYEKKLQSDPDTMSYNAGFDVSYDGYHYDTGCIDFPEENFQKTFDRRINEGRFFAYLKDDLLDEFVGYVNYQYDKFDDRYECGILIEHSKRGRNYSVDGLKLLCDEARNNGITALYDHFESDRNGLSIFEKLGFKIVEKTSFKKFGKDVEGIVVKIDL